LDIELPRQERHRSDRSSSGTGGKRQNRAHETKAQGKPSTHEQECSAVQSTGYKGTEYKCKGKSSTQDRIQKDQIHRTKYTGPNTQDQISKCTGEGGKRLRPLVSTSLDIPYTRRVVNQQRRVTVKGKSLLPNLCVKEREQERKREGDGRDGCLDSGSSPDSKRQSPEINPLKAKARNPIQIAQGGYTRLKPQKYL
jgi:hypothetical protein